MELPAMTINNTEITTPQIWNSSNCTPMILTTASNGVQSLTPIPQSLPVLGLQSSNSNSLPNMPTLPFSPLIVDPASLPMFMPTMIPQQPSNLFIPFSPLSMPSVSPSPSGSMFTPSSSNELWTVSCSRERDAEQLEIEPFESERPIEDEEPKEPSMNVNKIPVPTMTEDMKKKDLVSATLDWLYEVFGSDHFDCEGRRGTNVLRVKVKTRGALEHICPFLSECMDEGLIYHVSCPISTKKARQHIRGYLAYIEAISQDAADRVVEIFNKHNKVLIKNCDGELEHPFKNISRNPKAIRRLANNIMNQGNMAA
jgi:hypothetical protein